MNKNTSGNKLIEELSKRIKATAVERDLFGVRRQTFMSDITFFNILILKIFFSVSIREKKPKPPLNTDGEKEMMTSPKQNLQC